MNKALRLCYRTSHSSALRCQSAAPKGTRCLAAAICPARTLSPSASVPQQQSRRRINTQTQLGERAYSTREGTIGKGEEGVVDEVKRTKEVLEAPEHLNEKEREIWGLLQKELEATSLKVMDISGGCGSMYGIDIVSEKFRGLSMLKQQRLVNEVLGEEIKGWHGVQLKTRAP